jgi:hypothetical protein
LLGFCGFCDAFAAVASSSSLFRRAFSALSSVARKD